jgi:hypothetical protein
MARPGWKRRPAWRTSVAALAVCVVSALLVPVPAGADEGGWTRPVDGAVVRPFEEPVARFAPGHRGVDFAAAPGTPVRAANDGRVTFAGAVAGSLHVVVAHAAGIRTSYSFLLRVDVRTGDLVRRGQVVGAAGGTGPAHGPGVLHLGARIGERYIDPMLLFGPTDLTKLVRLVPIDERVDAEHARPSAEARAIRALLRDWGGDDYCAGGIPVIEQACDAGEAVGDAATWTWDRVEEAADLGLAALRAVGRAGAALARRVAAAVREVVRAVEDAARHLARAAEEIAHAIADGPVALFNAVVAAGKWLIEHLTSCPQPPPVRHPKGSGNLVMAVGGLGSSRHPKSPSEVAPSFDFQRKAFGYKQEDVAYFSYSADGPAYDKKDTYGDLHEKARLLGKQLKEFATEHPGRKIDLMAHSQGGVVIDLFLMEVYRGHEQDYPRIGNVVTFASPHLGTPLADLETSVDHHLVYAAIADALASGQPLGAPSVSELAEGSQTIEHLWSNTEIPPGIRFLSIMGSEDPVVPSTSGFVPGGDRIVVPVGDALVPDDHSAILADDDAISAAQAQLSGGHPADSCGLFVDVGAVVYSTVVRAAAASVKASPGAKPPVEPPLTPRRHARAALDSNPRPRDRVPHDRGRSPSNDARACKLRSRQARAHVGCTGSSRAQLDGR